MSEKTVQMTMLFDFYGDLLTEKQREYFDLYYNEDYSLSEIAENAGITRQGVHDIIARDENTVVETEKKTGLRKRFNDTNKALDGIAGLALSIEGADSLEDARAYARQIDKLIGELKG